MASKRRQVKVMVAGAFDILHPGHLSFFAQARRLGNYLVVIVARDATVSRVKRHTAFFSEQERLEMVSSLRQVDKAMLGTRGNILRSVLREKPQVVALGYDQEKTVAELKSELAALGFHRVKIVKLRPHKPNKFKSTNVKKFLLGSL